MSDSNCERINHDSDNDLERIEFDTVRILVERAKGGDADAHSLLARQVQSYLQVMAGQKMPTVLKQQQNASDIVQQTMIQMLNGIDKFRGETTREFYGWLNKILQNESLKATLYQTRQKRDARKTQSLENDDMSFRNNGAVDRHPSPRSEMIANERIELYRKAMTRLSDSDARVIRLRSIEEKPFKEIASEIDKSVDAVRKSWVRAVAKLQGEIENIENNRG